MRNQMRLTVVLDHKFYRFANGQIGSLTAFGPTFWERYLRVFDRVRVVCRVRQDIENKPGIVPVVSDRIEFCPVPFYEGFGGFASRLLAIRRLFWNWFQSGEAYILRAPQLLPNVAMNVLRAKSIPFGVEVVGDPWDLYAPGAEGHILRPVIRWYAYRKLRAVCQNACAASYVTEHALQRRYPVRNGVLAVHASSIELDRVDEVPRSVAPEQSQKRYRILFVGTLNRLYKGQDTLVEAGAMVVHQLGLDIELRFVGEGKEAGNLKNLCKKLDIEDRVVFLGALPQGEAVIEEMRRSDLFVLPSRQEGLPRSLIEAMSVGVPCLATNVGGIPELLESSCMVEPGRADLLAEKIGEVLKDPSRQARMSFQHLQKAGQYTTRELQPRRELFYESLRETVRGVRS